MDGEPAIGVGLVVADLPADAPANTSAPPPGLANPEAAARSSQHLLVGLAERVGEERDLDAVSPWTRHLMRLKPGNSSS